MEARAAESCSSVSARAVGWCQRFAFQMQVGGSGGRNAALARAAPMQQCRAGWGVAARGSCAAAAEELHESSSSAAKEHGGFLTFCPRIAGQEVDGLLSQ